MLSNEIISYMEMCAREGLSLQRGMNFNAAETHSIVLSSHRPGAPYDDILEENGTVLIYEGHDEPKTLETPYPKQVDQPLTSKSGRPTQNGLFHHAAQSYFRKEKPPARVRVYEKIKDGIWSYNGLFALVDSWTETSGNRRVFKFKLDSIPDEDSSRSVEQGQIEQRRLIPSHVKVRFGEGIRGLACPVAQPKTFTLITYSLIRRVGLQIPKRISSFCACDTTYKKEQNSYKVTKLT